MALNTPTMMLAAGLGLLGLLTTRHLLPALVAMQIMAKGALLVLPGSPAPTAERPG